MQNLLKNEFERISYQVGNIMQLSNLDNETFDIIITSNVFQHIDLFISKTQDPYVKIKEVFEKLKNHLNESGIIQLLYYYEYGVDNEEDEITYPTRDLAKIKNTLYPDLLSVYTFDDYTGRDKDAIVVYEKKRLKWKI